jgi:hypothetical protein
MTTRNSIIVLVVFGLLLVLAARFGNREYVNTNTGTGIGESTGTDTPNTPERIRIAGTYLCLPHTNPGDFQTLECAFGLKQDVTGEYYAIDLSLLQTMPFDYPTGSHLQIEGVFIPSSQLGSDILQRYPIEGVIGVTTVQEL